jgi:very-short-patch-repair endonuclease
MHGEYQLTLEEKEALVVSESIASDRRTVRIEGYLTESKLSKALQELLPDCWLGDQVPVTHTRQRWDMAFNRDGRITVVEYDGDEHYRHSIKIKGDRAKDETARSHGWQVVRFPYWIQLDTTTLKHFFGIDATVEQSFPHGFITTKLFPASFCELGIERFRAELDELPPSVREAVISSLRGRIAEHGLRYVIPGSLVDLI